MIFTETGLKGAHVVEIEPKPDDRGFFARAWCREEFREHDLEGELAQCNVSFNHKKGTWRGMHYQLAPHAEAKLVRCTRGAIFDVIVDLRAHSPTFRDHFSAELSADNRRMLYVPEGFAHGFITLEDKSEVFYQMSDFHAPDSARGFRWNDPFFRIELPLEISVISERDRTYPDFEIQA